MHRWGAASTSTCGATFAAFISLGSSKVAIRIGLSAYPTPGILSFVVFRECGAFVSN